MAKGPMHQFEIADILPFQAGGLDLSFTNASAYMVLGVALSAGLMIFAMRNAAVVPGRGQLMAEGLYNLVRGMLVDATGEEGVKKFFPFVFTLFLFILAVNMVGLFPYAFNPNSQIIVTALMALAVFLTVIVVGIAKNGMKFFSIFFPAGINPVLYAIVTPIEIVSFFSRPLSHSVRLWANIFAGAILLKVFAGFVPMMAEAGAVGAVGSILPFVMTVMLYGLKALVAFLQAYVFAILTCIYLNDALHPGHH